MAPASVAPVRGLAVLGAQLSHGLLRCAVGYIPSPPFGGWAGWRRGRPTACCRVGCGLPRWTAHVRDLRRRAILQPSERRPGSEPWISAPKGQNGIAQGNALGTARSTSTSPERAGLLPGCVPQSPTSRLWVEAGYGFGRFAAPTELASVERCFCTTHGSPPHPHASGPVSGSGRPPVAAGPPPPPRGPGGAPAGVLPACSEQASAPPRQARWGPLRG